MTKPITRKLRCAVYTRKSSEEGLEQEFNSLHAQREACEAYVASQRSEGWALIRDPYDDGGFSGGTLERPALKRLLADIEEGLVDVVVVYKIDRLSPLADGLLEARRGVRPRRRHLRLASPSRSTPPPRWGGSRSTSCSASPSSSARSPPSASATRSGRRGRRACGWAAPCRSATRSRTGSSWWTRPTRRSSDRSSSASSGSARRRCWRGSCGARASAPSAASSSTRATSTSCLNNRTYLGLAVHKGTAYPGEHAAIIAAGRSGTRCTRSSPRTPAPARRAPGRRRRRCLKGLIFGPTGAAMSPTHTRKGNRLYRYYVSQDVLKRGPEACPVGRVPAAEIEAAVIDQLRGVFRQPEIIVGTWRAARAEQDDISEEEAREALTQLDPLWDELFPAEQARIVQLLVERVDVGLDGVEPAPARRRARRAGARDRRLGPEGRGMSGALSTAEDLRRSREAAGSTPCSPIRRGASRTAPARSRPSIAGSPLRHAGARRDQGAAGCRSSSRSQPTSTSGCRTRCSPRGWR